MKLTRKTYVAGCEIAPVPGIGWMATGLGGADPARNFHKDLFGIGDDPAEAVKALAQSIRDALRSPLAKQRGWSPGRFDQVVIMHASSFQMDELPED